MSPLKSTILNWARVHHIWCPVSNLVQGNTFGSIFAYSYRWFWFFETQMSFILHQKPLLESKNILYLLSTLVAWSGSAKHAAFPLDKIVLCLLLQEVARSKIIFAWKCILNSGLSRLTAVDATKPLSTFIYFYKSIMISCLSYVKFSPFSCAM